MIRTLSQIYVIAIGIVIIVAGTLVTLSTQLDTTVAGAQTAHAAQMQERAQDREEILWLARIVYSETKRPREQVLIGWVVRNRVDTKYFGDTYKEVALAKGQFSGLHSFDKQYRHNITRDYESTGKAWKHALKVARAIYYADPALRPFPKTMRHFYSPISVSRTPKWAEDRTPIHTISDSESDHVRFAFYAQI